MTATAPVRIALIGTRGYGKTHLQNLERLTAAGLAELIGVVDIAEPLEQLRGIWHRDLAALLAAHAQAPPEVVIIATPIDTHVPLARQALAAGCHVYLEKPPVPALEDHWSLLEAAEAAPVTLRSEERRVGKECRSRWSTYHEKRKNEGWRERGLK